MLQCRNLYKANSDVAVCIFLIESQKIFLVKSVLPVSIISDAKRQCTVQYISKPRYSADMHSKNLKKHRQVIHFA